MDHLQEETMELQSFVLALGCLCLLAVGFPEFESPKIIGPVHIKIKIQPGKMLVLHCDASTSLDEEVLIYWLINGSFPEETHSSGRIQESNERMLLESSIIQKSLLLRNITSEDFNSTFCCVVTNAAGMAQKFIKLKEKKYKKHTD